MLDKQEAERVVLTAADLPGCTVAAPDTDTPGEAPNLDVLSRLLTDELRKDPMFTNATVTTARLPALTVGDESVGYRSVARFRVSGTPVTMYTDSNFFRSSRAVSRLELTSASTAFPAGERSRLATVLAGRMATP